METGLQLDLILQELEAKLASIYFPTSFKKKVRRKKE